MATLCKLCGKKIGFFDASYTVLDNVMCEDCNCSYKKVLDSASDIEKFEKNLAEFKKAFDGKEFLDEIVKYLEDTHKTKMAEKQQAEENEKASWTANDHSDEFEISSNRRNSNIGPFENQDLVYSIDGVRGRHIDIYKNKVVITVNVTLGSLMTHNATDGEKTIYYTDCIGVQFKPSKFTIGYLQLETASSNGNHKNSNFFEENSFTFDTSVISNEKMTEVANYVKSRVDNVKNGNTTSAANNISVADELLKLKQLLDIGILTQEEFDAQKQKLLNQ